MPYRDEGDTPSEPNPHPLDAVIWRALTGVRESLAEGDERARRYPAAIAPFAATMDTEPASFRSLLALVRGDDRIALFTTEEVKAPPAFSVIRRDSVDQMVLENTGACAAVPPGIAYERGKSGMPYILAVRLNDRSWLIFTVPSRIWGVSSAARWAIWLSFLALSIAVATALAAPQFSRPVQQLAAAVHQFGIDPRAPPIPETGPKELRQVIRTFNAMQAQIQKFVAYRTMMLAAGSFFQVGHIVDDTGVRPLMRAVVAAQSLHGPSRSFPDSWELDKATPTKPGFSSVWSFHWALGPEGEAVFVPCQHKYDAIQNSQSSEAQGKDVHQLVGLVRNQ